MIFFNLVKFGWLFVYLHRYHHYSQFRNKWHGYLGWLIIQDCQGIQKCRLSFVYNLPQTWVDRFSQWCNLGWWISWGNLGLVWLNWCSHCQSFHEFWLSSAMRRFGSILANQIWWWYRIYLVTTVSSLLDPSSWAQSEIRMTLLQVLSIRTWANHNLSVHHIYHENGVMCHKIIGKWRNHCRLQKIGINAR